MAVTKDAEMVCNRKITARIVLLALVMAAGATVAQAQSDGGNRPVIAGVFPSVGPSEKWKCTLGGNNGGNWGILGHDLVAPPSDLSGERVHYPIVKNDADALIAMSDVHPGDRHFEMIVLDKKSLHIKQIGILLASDYQEQFSGECTEIKAEN